jgi:hypothetical protein
LVFQVVVARRRVPLGLHVPALVDLAGRARGVSGTMQGPYEPELPQRDHVVADVPVVGRVCGTSRNKGGGNRRKKRGREPRVEWSVRRKRRA